jgi:hypothetical protein
MAKRERNFRVLLLGDFIRLAYQPRVAELLAAEEGITLTVVGPPQSNGDSAQLAVDVDRWLDEVDPEAVHFNCGLEDVRWYGRENRNAVPIGDYELNLVRIVDACKAKVGGDVVFALTTPVDDKRQCDRPGGEFDRFNRDIEEYNIAAQEVMLAENVLINHLDRVIAERDDEYLEEDGISLTQAGVEAAARATAQCIRSLWH